MRNHSNKVVDVRNKLRIYWLAMFGWQATRPGEWGPVDLTNIPRDVAHPLQHPSARGTKRAQKNVHLGPFIDVFPSKVSHLFHTQTPSNWIVNLWWRLIIRPASEVLMRSYFSWMTSPQITPGDSGLRVLTCFFECVFFLQEELNCQLYAFPGAASGFKFVRGTVKSPYFQNVSLYLLSLTLRAPHSSSKWQTLTQSVT